MKFEGALKLIINIFLKFFDTKNITLWNQRKIIDNI